MLRVRRRSAVLVALVATSVVGAGIGLAVAQEEAQDPSTTTTTILPDLTTTTTPPGTDTTAPGDTTSPDTTEPTDTTSPDTTLPADDSSVPPPAPEDDDASAPGRVVPSEAQAVIDSIPRTRPNNSQALVDGAAALEALGVPRQQAVLAVFGSFPIQGYARWSDDWYYPRWTGTQFRFHQGVDMVAEYGTPVAAPADGVARISNSGLGGLAVRVVQSDGTFFYLAHLSAVADGIRDGTPVLLGQVVGFVGDSGNARGGVPHLHFEVHPRGGGAVPPKPYVDRWVAEGAARATQLLGSVQTAPRSAAVVAIGLTRGLAAGMAPGGGGRSGPPRSDLLWASSANPAGGGVQLAEASAAAVADSVDWDLRALQQQANEQAWSQSADRARQVLAPLTSPVLRQAAEARRATVAG
jgi:murein DD-endopeptidase MepM/ murein hydrolase activator NlpD